MDPIFRVKGNRLRDLIEVLGYVGDDKEYDDFARQVIENGTPGLDEQELAELKEKYGGDEVAEQRCYELLAKAALHQEERHVFALVHRLWVAIAQQGIKP